VTKIHGPSKIIRSLQYSVHGVHLSTCADHSFVAPAAPKIKLLTLIPTPFFRRSLPLAPCPARLHPRYLKVYVHSQLHFRSTPPHHTPPSATSLPHPPRSAASVPYASSQISWQNTMLHYARWLLGSCACAPRLLPPSSSPRHLPQRLKEAGSRTALSFPAA
jgi:hypothetical protein